MKKYVLPALLMFVLILSVAVFSVLSATSAEAEDRRPCVSKVEWRSIDGGSTIREVEKQWEVEGLGLWTKTVFGRVKIYPRCGYTFDDGVYEEGEPVTAHEAWYGAQFRNNKLHSIVSSLMHGATLQGHPRS